MKELDKGDYWPLLSQEERDACYNGMGAGWMPEFSRDILDMIFEFLDDGVRVHDVDFYYCKKTEDEFHKANKRMKRNFLYLTKKNIPWWRFLTRRLMRKVVIPVMYAAVESYGGRKSFFAGEKKNIENI